MSWGLLVAFVRWRRAERRHRWALRRLREASGSGDVSAPSDELLSSARIEGKR
ncbi:MAG: hypothetical protein ACRD0W_05760 [Acidimicrobiales bacterium]